MAEFGHEDLADQKRLVKAGLASSQIQATPYPSGNPENLQQHQVPV